MDERPVPEADVANWLEGTTNSLECAIAWFGLDIDADELFFIMSGNGMRVCSDCGWWWRENRLAHDALAGFFGLDYDPPVCHQCGGESRRYQGVVLV